MPENNVENKTLWYPKYFYIGAILSFLTIYFFVGNEKSGYIVRTLTVGYIGIMIIITYLFRVICSIDINNSMYKMEKPLFIRVISKSVVLVFGHGLGFSALYFLFHVI